MIINKDWQQLIEDVDADKVRQAREMKPVDKLFSGPDLFDEACEVTRAGIRSQYPEASQEDVERIVRERLALREELEAACRPVRLPSK